MTTLKDVAREAGLAIGTVSRVLNNRGYISEDTRKHVYAVMERLHYQPNEVARSLIKQSSSLVGVIVPHIQHPYFADLISCLEAAAAREKLTILLYNASPQQEKLNEYLEMCVSNRVAGIILCSGALSVQKLLDTHIPIITLERELEQGVAAVECDNARGGRLAARELIACGCRNLLHISGVSGVCMPADERALGFVAACEETGVAYHVIATDQADYHNMDYHDLLTAALQEHPETDGVFTSSDLIAAQLLQVCTRQKIAVPQQLKIVGYDDENISCLTIPPLTTIHQPVREMAKAAITLLQNAVAGEVVASRVVLPVTMIRRGSTYLPDETIEGVC